MFEERTETELAYLAGILDGEGSIMIKHDVSKNKDGSKVYHSYSLLVSIGNTDPDLLKWLESFGGKVYINRKSSGKPGKPMYQWQIRTRQAAWLLEALYPYMIIKKKKAAAAMFFQEIRGNTRYRDAGSSRLDRELRELISPGRKIE